MTLEISIIVIINIITTTTKHVRIPISRKNMVLNVHRNHKAYKERGEFHAKLLFQSPSTHPTPPHPTPHPNYTVMN